MVARQIVSRDFVTRREKVRAADAKEVGVGNPAEETYCYPNNWIVKEDVTFCQHRNNTVLGREYPTLAANPGAILVAMPAGIRDVLADSGGDFTFA